MRVHPTTCFRALTLIRHAKSRFNEAISGVRSGQDNTAFPNWESPLTPEGENQARQTGAWLARKIEVPHYDPLLVSTLVRSRMTAGIIGQGLANGFNKPFDDWEVVPDLNERNFGLCNEIAGLAPLLHYLESQKPRIDQPLSWQPLGGETLDQVRVRASGFLDRLNAGNSGRSPLIVTSSWPIWAMCAQIEDWEPEELERNLADPSQYLGHCDAVQYLAEGFGLINDVDGYMWKRVVHFPNIPVSSEDGWERVARHRRRTSKSLLHTTERYRIE